MTESRLAMLLGARRRAAVRSADCASDDVVAAFLDATLEPEARDRFEKHLADCVHCTSLVVAVVRSEASAGATDNDLLVARASRLASRRARFRGAPVWASAAALLLAIGVFSSIHLPSRDLDGARTVRGERLVDRTGRVPTITSPTDRASIEMRDLEVSWSAVSGAHYYEVRLVDDDGDLILAQRVAGTEWKPRGLDLPPGADYYVRVDGFAEDGRPRSSAHVLFHVIAPN